MLLVSFLLNFALPFSRKAKLLVTLLLVIFLGGYGSLLGLDGVVNRFSMIDISGLARLNIYKASLPLVYDHPLTGIGVDSYKLLSGVYLKEFPENTLYDHAHNDYLEAVIELGLPMAGLFFVWIFLGVAVSGKRLLERRVLVQDEQGAAIIIGTAAFCALLGFLVHGGVDFGWRLPANAVYAVTLVALVTNATRHKRHFSEPTLSTSNHLRKKE